MAVVILLVKVEVEFPRGLALAPFTPRPAGNQQHFTTKPGVMEAANGITARYSKELAVQQNMNCLIDVIYRQLPQESCCQKNPWRIRCARLLTL